MKFLPETSEENKSEKVQRLEKERLPIVDLGDGQKIIGWFQFNAALVADCARGKKRFGLLGRSAKIITRKALMEKRAQRARIAALEQAEDKAETFSVRTGTDGAVRYYQPKPEKAAYSAWERRTAEQRKIRKKLLGEVKEAVQLALALQVDLQRPIVFHPPRKLRIGKYPPPALVK